MSKDESLLSALLTTNLQVLETLKTFKADIDALKFDINEIKEETSQLKLKDDTQEIRTIVKEELAQQDLTPVNDKLAEISSEMETVRDATEVVTNTVLKLIETAPDRESLEALITEGFSQSTKDYTKPMEQLVKGFEVTQENLKAMARHIDNVNTNMEDITASTVENSARLTSLDIRMATMVKETMSTDQTLDSAIDTLKSFQIE